MAGSDERLIMNEEAEFQLNVQRWLARSFVSRVESSYRPVLSSLADEIRG